MKIVITPWLSTRTQGWVILFLLAGHILTTIPRRYFGVTDQDYWGFNSFFNLDTEQTLPTLFAVLQLVACCLLLAIIASNPASPARERPYWRALAALFAFLVLDEFLGIHERIGYMINDLYISKDVFRHAWVLAYIPLVIVLGVLFLRFVWQLPNETRRLFFLAGGSYLLGSVGFELVAEVLRHEHGRFIILAVTAEETLEFSGLIIFIHALLGYIQQRSGPVTLEVGEIPS